MEGRALIDERDDNSVLIPLYGELVARLIQKSYANDKEIRIDFLMRTFMRLISRPTDNSDFL